MDSEMPYPRTSVPDMSGSDRVKGGIRRRVKFLAGSCMNGWLVLEAVCASGTEH